MKDDFVYIDHILVCIRKILDYTREVSPAEFERNELIQDAVIRNIEIIGEASKKVSKDLKSVYPEIPWREISGMRDKLIHDYMGVDKGVVWKTIKEDIPYIQSLIQKIER
jgi:uncharacterized protein with HEPN domain